MSDKKLRNALLEDVVIFATQDQSRTGAQAIAPDHSPRVARQTRALPPRALNLPVASTSDIRLRVEEFLFFQSELLDGKHWSAYIDLFDDDGVYWMPASPDQTEWLDSPSIFAEDRPMMEVRMGRVTHPNAWSQAPAWATSHIVGNVVVEQETETELRVRSRFMMTELRRDQTRHFTGQYQHTLRKLGDQFRIKLQRVDLLTAQAPFDYVLQVWV